MVSKGIKNKTELLKCFTILKIKVNGNAFPVLKHDALKMWKRKTTCNVNISIRWR
jgi:hypothetical protein